MDGSRFALSASATVLVVGSAAVALPAGAVALGVGSVLRGTSTYYETGSLGQAVLDGSTELVVGVIGLGAAAALAQTGQAARVAAREAMVTAERAAASASAARQSGVVTGRELAQLETRSLDAQLATVEAIVASGPGLQPSVEATRQFWAIVVLGAVTEGGLEGVTEVVKGADVRSAAMSAASRVAVDIVTAKVGQLLEKVAVPVQAFFRNPRHWDDAARAATIAGSLFTAATGAAVDSAGDWVVGPHGASAPPPPLPITQPQFVRPARPGPFGASAPPPIPTRERPRHLATSDCSRCNVRAEEFVRTIALRRR